MLKNKWYRFRMKQTQMMILMTQTKMKAAPSSIFSRTF